jgi:hypothetical protein
VGVIRLWHDENNALLRQKMTQGSMRATAPFLESISRQGCSEGVFDTEFPHEAAGIITAMGLHLADAFIDAIEADGAVGIDISGPHAQQAVAAYQQAFERILGMPTARLPLECEYGRWPLSEHHRVEVLVVRPYPQT